MLMKPIEFNVLLKPSLLLKLAIWSAKLVADTDLNNFLCITYRRTKISSSQTVVTIITVPVELCKSMKN